MFFLASILGIIVHYKFRWRKQLDWPCRKRSCRASRAWQSRAHTSFSCSAPPSTSRASLRATSTPSTGIVSVRHRHTPRYNTRGTRVTHNRLTRRETDGWGPPPLRAPASCQNVIDTHHATTHAAHASHTTGWHDTANTDNWKPRDSLGTQSQCDNVFCRTSQRVVFSTRTCLLLTVIN